MPMYVYKCPSCQRVSDEFMRMCGAAEALPILCNCCTPPEIMVRQVSRVHTDLQEFATPIELHSIGCTSVDQIREMQRAGVTISDDPADPLYGTPIARSRHEKLKALKVAKFQEAN